MRRLILILILFISSTSSILLAENQCLLIGVGNYPESSGWRKISSTNDVDLLEHTLETIFSVRTLIDKEATHNNIIKAINSLTNEAQPGDTILIHFSCHGQQVLTHDVNEPDGLDEALVPFDAQSIKSNTYWGQNHLLDNEFEKIITPLRGKVGSNGLVVITLDACFSDSMHRGKPKNDEIYRGSADIFGSNEISRDSLTKIKEKRKNSDTTKIGKLGNESDVCMLSACQSYEKNVEIERNGKHYGPLSYAMYCSFKDNNWGEITNWLDGVFKYMNEFAYSQNPRVRASFDYSDDVKKKEIQGLDEKDNQTPNKENEPPYLICYGIFILFVIISIIIIWKKKKH